MDEDELLNAIQRLPNKQCASDPIPTWLLKKISGMILPFVKSMVNQTFSEGIVPKSWKSAQVTPLLKKPSLDHNVASSYRPISNLPVLSKLSERLVLSRVMSYLNNSNLLPTHQSAYRRHHSTETAVTKVYSDILGGSLDLVLFSSESEKNSELFGPCIRNQHLSIKICKELGNL